MTKLMTKTEFFIPKYMGFNTGGQDYSCILTTCVGLILEEMANPTFDHYEDRNFRCRGWDDFRKDMSHQYKFVGYATDFKSWMTLAGMIINKTMGRDVMQERIPTLYNLCNHTIPKQQWYSGLESDGYKIPYVLDILTKKVSYNPYE